MRRPRPTPEALADRYALAYQLEAEREARAAAADRSERTDAMTREHHAAAEASGLPGLRRRGAVLPDWAPERWEVEGE